jgi:acyl-CoA thioester hydrolase
MSETLARPALDDRSLYRFWSRDIIRFGDLDRQGHVNNARFATYCESGRVAMLEEKIRPVLGPNESFVLASITINFRREMHYPGEVEIGTRILRLGTSSLSFGQGLFCKEHCAATAETTVVLLDPATRRPTPFPEAVRADLWRLAAD